MKTSHKTVIFHLSGEKPHWTDWNENLHWCRTPGHNHGCQVQIWKISGILMSLRSKFALSHWLCTWALPLCCVWFARLRGHLLMTTWVGRGRGHNGLWPHACYLLADAGYDGVSHRPTQRRDIREFVSRSRGVFELYTGSNGVRQSQGQSGPYDVRNGRCPYLKKS